VKCNGKTAKALTESASYLDSDGNLKGWLHDVWGTTEEWVVGKGYIFRLWREVLFVGRELEPTREQQLAFGPNCRTLFR
jgi:hypothetical protein